METVADVDLLVRLLALREAAGARAHHLAVALRSADRVEVICRDPSWSPALRDWHTANRQAAAIAALELRVVPVWSFPAHLLRLRNLPPMLFVRGAVERLEKPGVAIVGSRLAAASAITWALARGRQAAERGTLVVSGGARGVDAAAHRGALRAGGQTVAYLGVAIDRLYPMSNRALFERIVESGGALASEHPPGVVTYASAHALRNRFIAAQADEVLIAEAGSRSGTLGTAKFARQIGVPVLISPPGVGRERAGLDMLAARGGVRIWHDREARGPGEATVDDGGAGV